MIRLFSICLCLCLLRRLVLFIRSSLTLRRWCGLRISLVFGRRLVFVVSVGWWWRRSFTSFRSFVLFWRPLWFNSLALCQREHSYFENNQACHKIRKPVPREISCKCDEESRGSYAKTNDFKNHAEEFLWNVFDSRLEQQMGAGLLLLE